MRCGNEMNNDPSLVPKPKQPVYVKVQNVTLDYLLETTQKPLGLTYRLTETSLEVVPAN